MRKQPDKNTKGCSFLCNPNAHFCCFVVFAGHYTCHTKSVITKPQNVCVMRDIMCSGYVAGGNTRFFGVNSKTGNFINSTKENPSADPVAVVDAMNARLTFQNDDNEEYDSMFAFCAPYGDAAKRDQVISISERLLPWEVNRDNGGKEYFPGGSGNFTEVKERLGLNQIHFGEDTRASENMEFISQVRLLSMLSMSACVCCGWRFLLTLGFALASVLCRAP